MTDEQVIAVVAALLTVGECIRSAADWDADEAMNATRSDFQLWQKWLNEREQGR